MIDSDIAPNTSVTSQQNEIIAQVENSGVLEDDSAGVHAVVSDDDNSKCTGVTYNIMSNSEITGVSFNEPNANDTNQQITQFYEKFDHGTNLTIDNPSSEEHNK